MTTSLKTWSRYASDDEGTLSASDKAYFQARNRRRFHNMVLERFANLSSDGRISRAKIARRLGINPAQVTRWIAAPGNWTLDTLSDLMLAMACETNPKSEEIRDSGPANYAHPLSMPPDSKGAEKMSTSSSKNEFHVHVHESTNLPLRTESRTT